jgi:PAS domain S-box-containing protein/diguanylate cyclase (GGDEF)-like protein
MARGEEQYEALVLHSTDIAMVFDSDGTILYITPSMESVSGYRAEELVGTQGFDFVHPDDLATDFEDVVAAISAGSSITREWRLCLADGSWAWYEFTLTDLRDEPAIRGIVGHFRDVSAQHTADAARRESELLFRKTVELASDAILAIDPDDRITAWNPSAALLFGWSADEAVGREVADLVIPPEERERYLERFGRAAAGEVPYLLERPFEMVGVDRSGRRFPAEVSVVQFELGGGFQLQALVRDIGPRKQTEARLAGHGFIDPLTKLPNRALLADRLALALSRMARRSTKVSVMLLDLDDRAAMTAGLPPTAGDELIVGVSRRLSVAIRASDTVARYDEEQFVIVAEDLKDLGDAEIIADRVLETLSAPLTLAGRELNLSASLGIAWAEASSTPADELLREAYEAMGHARADGGGRRALFQADSAAGRS